MAKIDMNDFELISSTPLNMDDYEVVDESVKKTSGASGSWEEPASPEFTNALGGYMGSVAASPLEKAQNREALRRTAQPFIENPGQAVGDMGKGLLMAVPAGLGETAASFVKGAELASELTGGDKWLRPWWTKHIPESILKPAKNLISKGSKVVGRLLPKEWEEIPTSDVIGEGISDTAYKLTAPIEEEAKELSAPGQFAYQVGKPVANIVLTGTAGNALATGLQSAAAQEIIKMTPFMLSAAGNYAKEAELDGASPLQQAAYGTVMGIMEGATERVPFEKWFGLVGGKRGVMYWIKSMGIEGLQELLMDPMAGIAKKGMQITPDMPWTGKGGVFDLDQMIQSGAGGIGTGALMAGGSAVTNRILDRMAKDNREVQVMRPLEEMVQQEIPKEAPMSQPEPVKEVSSDRRINTRLREKMQNMNQEEVYKNLYQHELTGMLNARAYDEVLNNPKLRKPIQVEADIDGLKWFNDVLGHDTGNTLLKNMADALKSLGHEDVFHKQGDEFFAQFNTEEEAVNAMAKVDEFLKRAKIRVELPDGSIKEFEGGAFSYGVGQTPAEADAELRANKEQRAAAGYRSARGEKPPSVRERTIRVGNAPQGVEGVAGNQATEVISPKPDTIQPAPDNKKTEIPKIDLSKIKPGDTIWDSSGRTWGVIKTDSAGVHVRSPHGAETFVGLNHVRLTKPEETSQNVPQAIPQKPTTLKQKPEQVITAPNIKVGDSVHYTYRGIKGGGEVVEDNKNTFGIEPMEGSYRVIKVNKNDVRPRSMKVPSGDEVFIDRYNIIADNYKEPEERTSGYFQELARKIGVKNPDGATISHIEKYLNIFEDNNKQPIVISQPVPKTEVSQKGDAIKPEGDLNGNISKNEPKQVSNEPVRRHVPGTREEIPAEHVSRDESSRDANATSLPSAGEGEGSKSGTGRAGIESGSSGGDRSARLHTPKTRKEPVEIVNRNNYRITAADKIGSGTEGERLKNNIEAIKTLKKIKGENRKATPEEQAALVKYVGWGGLSNVFNERVTDGQMAKTREELQKLLSPEAYRAASASTKNAHYTSQEVIEAMWEGVKHLGFNNGYVLEPAAGVGHFIGLMPQKVAQGSRVTGVELDPITGTIAQYLYPDSDIQVSGFEKTDLSPIYDLAISNVPFGDYAVYDDKIPKPMRTSIHNYFFAKALETVRPGGLIVFITSRYTMDARANNSDGTSPRKYMDNRANFVGAIRLPNTAFKGNAGTEVVTDIIVLQKKGDGIPKGKESWLNLKRMDENDHYSPYTNEYFHKHPEMILGKEALTGSMYGGKEYTVDPNGEPLGPQIAKAFNSMPKVFKPKVAKNITNPKPVEMIAAPGELKEGSFTVKEGKLYRNRKGSLSEETANPAEVKRISKQIELIDLIKENMRIQYSDGTDAEIKESQAKLNKAYDSFVKEYGYLHSKTNIGKFADDPEFNRLISVENWDSKTQKGTKSDIFSKRTIQQYKPPTSADNSHEALIYSLNETNGVDLEFMSSLTGESIDKIISDLGDTVFQNPDSGQWETTDSYLSGNVRAKLKTAQNHAKLNPKFKRNVDALEKVIPEDIVPSQIKARLGAVWIEPAVYSDFVKSIFGSGIELSYSPVLGEWKVGKGRYSSLSTNEYGTADKDFYELLKLSMNNQKPEVYDKVDINGNEARVLNQQKTLAAVAKQEKIQKAFEEWIWQDKDRAEKMARVYNDTNNNTVLRSWDGSHMTFPGMNPVWAMQLKPHQKNAIWRGVQGGNALLAHCVGAGKTAEQIGIAMELKRLGIVRKMVWAVPKALIQQAANNTLEVYPGAKILVAGEKSFGKAERREFMNKIATGDWDLIIMSHSNLNSIPMSETAIRNFYNERIDALRDAVNEEVELGTRSDRGLVKKLEKMISNLEAKLEEDVAAIKKRQDVGNISWEETGVDGLTIDEAHEYKNLYYHTKMEKVAGLGSQQGVQKTTDLYMKVRHLQKLNGGRGIIFATGTAVSNSIAELYHMQRYLQPDALADRGITTFDAWVNNFAQVTPEMEMKPAGNGYRLKDRLSTFVNLPELKQMFRTFADVQTPDMLKLPVPDIATGKPEEIAAEPREELIDYIKTLAERASVLKGKPEKGGDNMLKISGDGRKASLDMRLVNPSLPDDPGSKVNLTVNRLVEHYHETAKYKGTQAVFLDLSTPGKAATQSKAKDDSGEDVLEELGLSELSDDEKALKTQDSAEAVMVYQDIKKKLISKGIPAHEIAFIHDAKTKEARQQMFENINSGKIRIVLGSTKKLGTGANIQERLFALYNLDAPWKPAEVEQRIGRGLRQGNKHMEWKTPIHIYNVITKKSFDARTWNILGMKQRFISQLMSPDMSTRQIGDPGGDAVLNFAEVAAIASDNPDILRDIELDNIAAKYRAMKVDYERGQKELKRKLNWLPDHISALKKTLAKGKELIAARKDTTGDKFVITLGKKTVTKRDEADEYIKKIAEKTHVGEIGNFAGIPISMDLVGGKLNIILDGSDYSSGASISSLEYTVKHLEKEVSDREERIRRLEQELSDTHKTHNKPFEYDTELAEAEAESKAIKQRLLEADKPNPIEQASEEIDQAIAEGGQGLGFLHADATKIATGVMEGIDRVKRAINALFGNDDSQVTVSDAAVERVLNATKSPLNIKAQVKESIQGVGKALKDIFVYEWTVKNYPGFQNDIRLFKGVSRDAQKFSLDMILKILKPLQTSREFEMFRRLVFLRDLEQGVQEAEPDATGVARNIGLTEAQIKAAQKELWTLAAKVQGSDTRLKMALWAHDKVYKAMWEDLKLRGKVSPEAANREHYVPHRVLDYMNDVDRRFPNLSKRFKTPYRYYLKGRSGSQKLIDTDYVGITLRHFAKLYMDNATDDFNVRIATKFDQDRKLTRGEKAKLYGKKKVPVPGKIYEYKDKRYIGWQYDPGRQMYPVVTATGKVVPAMGRHKKTYLLPIEIADRLTHFKDIELNSHVLNALRRANSIYKQILFSPVSLGLPFQMNNFVGDVIKLYAADAEALKYLGTGWKAAKQWQQGQIDKDLDDLVRLAEKSRVMESTFMREAGMPYDSKLARLQPKRYLLRKFNPFVKWSDISEQRELAPRLAKMYADMQRIDRGEIPRSNVIDVKALIQQGMSTGEVAGKLAREVTVDYHKMNGEAQRILRDILFPFFAFYYGNFPDWFKYAKKSPLNLAVKILLPTLIMTLWNWMKFRDIEEKLPGYYRVMPHIITGWRDKEGKPIIIALQTPFDMAAKMIGLDETIDIARRIQAGKISLNDGIKELGENLLFSPWEDFKDLLTPFIKAPIEAAMNKSWFSGRKIVPERLIGTNQDLQLRLKYVVEQWVSPVGNWSRQQGRNLLESGQKYFTRGPADIPRAFGVRHVDLGREQLNRFYERLSELQAKYKEYNAAKKEGKRTTFKEMGQYRLYSKTASSFSETNKRIAQVRNSKMPQAQKDKLIKQYQRQMFLQAERLLSRSK